MAEAQNPNEAGEVTPSKSSPESTDIPSANLPDPKGQGKTGADKPAAGEDKPAAAKKEKPPAVEEKPFAEFINQHYLPALKTALAKQGVGSPELSLEKQKIPIIGYAQASECWQVIGRWDRREFRVYFLAEDIQGQRGFSYAESGGKPSTLEPFLIDERKITLDLLVFGAIQRLNAQKWLARN